MGCNAKIFLPRDVATVGGIIAGLPFRRISLQGMNGFYIECIGTEIRTTTCPTMVELLFKANKDQKLIDGESIHFCTYFFECEDSNSVELYTASTSFWIALGIRLCRFFGGRIIFNDCAEDGDKAQRRIARPRKNNSPNDGKLWQKFEDEMANVKPLTASDLKRADKYGAYQMADMAEMAEMAEMD